MSTPNTQLLQELQEVCPKEWAADTYDSGGTFALYFHGLKVPKVPSRPSLTFEDDNWDAIATSVMLDHLESLGWDPHLYPGEDCDGQRFLRCELWLDGLWKGDHHGKTRAEAVAKALIAAVKGDDNV